MGEADLDKSSTELQPKHGLATSCRAANLMRSKHGAALFHFFGKLQMLVFARWRECAHEWRQLRLHIIASTIHYDKTLCGRIFTCWQGHVFYERFTRNAVAKGLARFCSNLLHLHYKAWAELVRALKVMQTLVAGRFAASRRRETQAALRAWCPS